MPVKDRALWGTLGDVVSKKAASGIAGEAISSGLPSNHCVDLFEFCDK